MAGAVVWVFPSVALLLVATWNIPINAIVCAREIRIPAAAVLAVAGASVPVQQPSTIPILIRRDVTVIDCAGHGVQPGISVLISSGRIAAIGAAARVTAPANAEMLDGKAALLAFLAQGVTGLRDMGSSLDDILRYGSPPASPPRSSCRSTAARALSSASDSSGFSSCSSCVESHGSALPEVDPVFGLGLPAPPR